MDALVHARHLRLFPETEALITALPDRAYIEKSVYHHDAARSGLLPLLDRWRADGLLRDPLDHRGLPGGDGCLRELAAAGMRSAASPGLPAGSRLIETTHERADRARSHPHPYAYRLTRAGVRPLRTGTPDRQGGTLSLRGWRHQRRHHEGHGLSLRRHRSRSMRALATWQTRWQRHRDSRTGQKRIPASGSQHRPHTRAPDHRRSRCLPRS